MKAAVCERFGPPEVVEIREVPTPESGTREMLVRNRATPVTYGDHRMRTRDLPEGMGWIGPFVLGWSKPKTPVLGFFFAGEVEKVGAEVTAFKPGDRIFGSNGFKLGCHAEYVVVAEDGKVAPMPEGLSFEDAAAITFGGGTGQFFFGKARPSPGDKVLINGASGSVGAAMLQQAKGFGAEVTAVCSGKNARFARSLGADHVIDYTQDDFSRNGVVYDCIVDCVGNIPLGRARNSLRPDGTFHQVVAGLGEMIRGAIPGLHGRWTVTSGSGTPGRADLLALGEDVVSGRLNPTIERVYPFADIVEAHRHVDTHRKRGNVVVTFS